MPISSYRAVLSKVSKVLYILLLSTLGLVWLNQQSLSLYWQQQFHRESPWSRVENPIWLSGGNLLNILVAAQQASATMLSGEPETVAVKDNHQGRDDTPLSETKKIPESASTQAECRWRTPKLRENLRCEMPGFLKIMSITRNVSAEPLAEFGIINLKPTTNVENTNRLIPGQPISLQQENQVLLVGDSMMQGVAPYVMKTLTTEYKIKSINLSKQNTGLAYPGFFNWPKTITDTLKKNPHIRLMVVFLGPNDPWDMPPGKGVKFYKFKSEEWEQLYRSRIKDILSQAMSRNINVIWIGPPNMRKKTLSDSMHYLNGLYESEVALANQLYIPVNDIFAYHDQEYSDYLDVDGHKVKLRSDDGTHFTLAGQKMIAEHILSFVTVDKTAPAQEQEQEQEQEQTKITENK